MTGSHAARPAPGRTRRRAHDLLREVLLTSAALFGLLCLVAVVLVAALDVGVIVFRTGSMSPTIPTGGAALVRALPADQVRVGDVVTVPSPVGGPLPVTHRVIATEPLHDDAVRLRLRGDANDAEDPFPYDVREVRRVVASAPGVGYALTRLGDPRTMGVVTVSVALLVCWALWPRAGRTAPRAGRPAPRATRRRARAAALATVTVVAATAGLVAAPSRAVAAPSTDSRLELSSSLPMGGAWDLAPGSDLAWRVESAVRPVEGTAGATGTLWVSLVAGGPLVESAGVRLVVQLCDSGWAGDGVTCPGGAREVVAEASDGEVRVDRAEVGELTSEAGQAVVVRLQVPAGLDDGFQGLGMWLGLRFDALGEEVYLDDAVAAVTGSWDGPGRTALGATGADLRPAVWGGLLVLAGGALVVRAGRHRRADHAPRRVGAQPEGVRTGAP